MPVYQQNGRWYFKIQIRGKRFNRAIPEASTKREAEKGEAIFKAELLQGRFNLANNKGEMLFEKLVNEFIIYAKTNRTGWKKDMSTVNHLKEYFGGKKIIDINPFAVEKYRSMRKNKEIANATINREVALLRKMFSIAVDNDWLDENPCLSKRVKPLRENNKKELFLTFEEEVELLKFCSNDNEYLKPIVICALNTGMRKGEILSLKWDCVDFKNKFITLLQTKSGKVRKIPINKRLFAEFKILSENKISEYVFSNPETKTQYIDIRKGFERACKSAKIENFVFHDLRHTAATRMVAAGIDLIVVKEILGHADISTTMRYSHPVPERKLKAVEALDYYSSTQNTVVALKA